MSSYLLFLILGVGAGAVYALLGLGLVLKYRAAGVVDFAHGAIAMFSAYVFVSLRDQGQLQLPWLGLPHKIQISSTGVSDWVAVPLTLVYAAILGLVLFVLVYRPLQQAAPLTRVCASVGIMLAAQAIAVLNFGTQAVSTRPLLPSGSFDLAGTIVPGDRLWFAGIVAVLTAVLALVYRYTRFGLATRAAAENSRGAALIGISATRIATQNWIIATLLAALAGILIAPLSTLDPISYTLLIVPALGVALVGRFESFAVTALAGLVLGMCQSEITKLLTVFTWLPQQGLPDGLPFLVILVAMTLRAPRLGARGSLATWANPSIGRPTRPLPTAVCVFAVGFAALVLLHGSLRSALIASFITACICLSLVVLTGYVGQVSLAQMSLAGVGAFMLSHLSIGWGIPFPFSLLLAALCAVPVGLVIGVPALRVRGVNLAIITLGAAAAMDALVFNASWFSGGLAGSRVDSPTLFGWDLGIAKGHDYPRVIFGVLVLLIVLAVGIGVARLRNSPTGRMFIAVRSNERAAMAAGIDVPRAKLLAFAISSFIAGLGGGLLAYQQGNVSPETFAVFNSLGLLAIAYVAGIGRIAGVAIAGVMLSSTGLMVSAIDKWIGVGKYQTLVAGIALAFTAIQNPDGLASTEPGTKGPGATLVRLRDRVLARRGPALAVEHEAAPRPATRVEAR